MNAYMTLRQHNADLTKAYEHELSQTGNQSALPLDPETNSSSMGFANNNHVLFWV